MEARLEHHAGFFTALFSFSARRSWRCDSSFPYRRLRTVRMADTVYNQSHFVSQSPVQRPPESTEETMSDTPREHFQELLENFSTAMLVTRTETGELRCRPMTIAEVHDDGNVVFVTSIDDAKAEEIRNDANVCVSLQKGQKYVSLSGTAELVQDRERLKSMWNEAWKVWYPDGPDSPEVTLLKVNATVGEYWDVSGLNGVKYLYRAGKAYFSGERPKMSADMHEKVQL